MLWQFLLCVLVMNFLPAERAEAAQAKPPTTAELALYQGKDRDKVLLDGAKKEGQVTFYTSNTWMAGHVSQEFGKKYPFIKTNIYRSDSKELLKRLTEEAAAGRQIADVVETSPDYMALLQADNLFQEVHLPEINRYDDEAKHKGKKGVLYWNSRELYISMGFNTKAIPLAEAPKTMKELLDPKWKNKMTIAGTTTGTQWIGAIVETFGMEFLEKLAAQNINVQNISGAALAELVSSGEVPLSPTIFNSNIAVLKQKGAPVEWRPIDPVIGATGMLAFVAKAPHPYAGLLFVDFLHSKEGQEAVVKGGLSSARNDVIDPEMKFKKIYIESKYPPEIIEKKFAEWEGLKRKLFISKR
ncbi:MAG: extracellular solute-binding protein [Deltaproteobacteria bacterium]|nr:extracellular solute-binding protein [Deltaproteobacteria bacterium]